MRKTFLLLIALCLAIIFVPARSQQVMYRLSSDVMAQTIAHSATLKWTAPVDFVSGNSYKVYRGASSGTETFLATASAATYVDSTVASGHTYFYYVTQVRALDGKESSASNEVSATVPLDPPQPPTGLGVVVN